MSNLRKSKVLSVRLHLEDLQSCFDLCEALGHPTNGASGAISRAVNVLMRDLRSKGTLPTYQASELEILVAQFISAKNPTSMMSLEALNNYDAVDRRTASPTVGTDNNDFAPLLIQGSAHDKMILDELAEIESGLEAESFGSTQDELNDLIDLQIRAQQEEEAEELLKKILIGG